MLRQTGQRTMRKCLVWPMAVLLRQLDWKQHQNQTELPEKPESWRRQRRQQQERSSAFYACNKTGAYMLIIMIFKLNMIRFIIRLERGCAVAASAWAWAALREFVCFYLFGTRSFGSQSHFPIKIFFFCWTHFQTDELLQRTSERASAATMVKQTEAK